VNEVKALYIALAVFLVAGIVSPGPAAAQAALSYNFTVTGETFSGVHPAGAIAGTLGGVAVDGAYSHGQWSLAAYGHPFASGTYTCVRVCGFTGASLAGRALIYTWTSQVPTWDARTQVTVGQLPALFASREQWGAQVAAWARAAGLPPDLQTRLIFDARTGM
jgi:hypothetical protein